MQFSIPNIIPKIDIYDQSGIRTTCRVVYQTMKGKSETEILGSLNKILSSTIGGALETWNQPIEVPVEMQSAKKDSLFSNLY
jgi:hypothetical protein